MKSGLRVADVMTMRPVVTRPGVPIRDVAGLMEAYGVSTVIVKHRDEVLGVVSETDIVTRGVLEGCDMLSTPVDRIMTKDIVTTNPDMDLFDVIALMRDTNVHTLPVVNEGSLAGFVTAKDILKIQPDLFENLVESFHLREEERKLMQRDRPIID